MRDTVSCTSAGAGRTGLPWGRRERQADGRPAGSHPRFFWNTFPAAAPRSPPFRFTRCAIPRTLPSRAPLRERPQLSRGPRLRQIAHRVFVEAGSGALAAGRRRRVGDEDGGIGISPKMRMVPCRASLPLPFPMHPHTRGATPAHRRALTPFHCIAGHLAPGERDAQFATRSAMTLKNAVVFAARHHAEPAGRKTEAAENGLTSLRPLAFSPRLRVRPRLHAPAAGCRYSGADSVRYASKRRTALSTSRGSTASNGECE